MKFCVGDLVKLRSGGPVMTVMQVPDEDRDGVKCQWFDGVKCQWFPTNDTSPVWAEFVNETLKLAYD